MKFYRKTLLAVLILALLNNFISAEVIERIYAVVNDEIITYSELKNYEQGMIASLQEEHQGEELAKMVHERKKQLLDSLIERKLLLSKAKEKNYNVEQYLDAVIKEIMNKNNFSTPEQLKKALSASGINYEDWKKFQMDELMTQSLIQNEIGARVQVDNAEVMEYYRKNIDQYKKPAEISLNCIFLNKDNYFIETALSDKKNEIITKLKDIKENFEEVAKEYSELPTENNIFLGTFKKGELNAKIEDAAFKLKQGEVSPWIKTETGWYIIQLKNFTESQLIQLIDVREEIEKSIKNDKMQVKVKEYVDQLKKNSHIKIYHEYK